MIKLEEDDKSTCFQIRSKSCLLPALPTSCMSHCPLGDVKRVTPVFLGYIYMLCMISSLETFCTTEIHAAFQKQLVKEQLWDLSICFVRKHPICVFGAFFFFFFSFCYPQFLIGNSAGDRFASHLCASFNSVKSYSVGKGSAVSLRGRDVGCLC